MSKNLRRVVGVNGSGRRIGEDHPCAVYSDTDVDHVFELREEGFSYKSIADMLECSRTWVRKVLSGELRNQTADHFKTVEGT